MNRSPVRYTGGARGGLSPGVVDHGGDCSAGSDTDVLPDQVCSEVRAPYTNQSLSGQKRVRFGPVGMLCHKASAGVVHGSL